MERVASERRTLLINVRAGIIPHALMTKHFSKIAHLSLTHSVAVWWWCCAWINIFLSRELLHVVAIVVCIDACCRYHHNHSSSYTHQPSLVEKHRQTQRAAPKQQLPSMRTVNGSARNAQWGLNHANLPVYSIDSLELQLQQLEHLFVFVWVFIPHITKNIATQTVSHTVVYRWRGSKVAIDGKAGFLANYYRRLNLVSLNISNVSRI